MGGDCFLWGVHVWQRSWTHPGCADDSCTAPVRVKPLKNKFVHLASEGGWPNFLHCAFIHMYVDARRWVGHLIFNLTVNLFNISKFILVFVKILLYQVLFCFYTFSIGPVQLNLEYLRWISHGNFPINFVWFIVCNVGICALVLVDQNTTPPTDLQLQCNHLLETTNLLHFPHLLS